MHGKLTTAAVTRAETSSGVVGKPVVRVLRAAAADDDDDETITTIISTRLIISAKYFMTQCVRKVPGRLDFRSQFDNSVIVQLRRRVGLWSVTSVRTQFLMWFGR